MPVHLPKSIEEATRVLADHPGATILGGGTDLMVEVNFNHRKPETVIALRNVAELREWSVDRTAGVVRIGALVPYRQMETGDLAAALPALAQAARTVGSPQIRAAGSIGGNLGTCSPAGDSLPVLAALDATVHLASESGRRDVSFAEFMVGPKRTSRAAGELITAITVPVLDGWQGYTKVGVRNAMVIATASVALAVSNADARVAIALGSVGPTILRCPEAEALAAQHADFTERRLAADVVVECGRLTAAASRPIDDHRSSAEYRRHAVGVLAGRLLRRAFPHE